MADEGQDGRAGAGARKAYPGDAAVDRGSPKKIAANEREYTRMKRVYSRVFAFIRGPRLSSFHRSQLRREGCPLQTQHIGGLFLIPGGLLESLHEDAALKFGHHAIEIECVIGDGDRR